MAGNTDTPKVPDWIHENFIAESLQKVEGDDGLQVESLQVDVLRGGLHSEIFRVIASVRRVNGQRFQQSMIVKCLTRSDMRRESVTVAGMFVRETLVYREMLSLVEASLRTVEREQYTALAPRCYHSCKIPTDHLILENLEGAGFRLAESGKLLDVKQCSLVLSNLARLHAASVLQQNHESFACQMFELHPLFLEGGKDFFAAYTQKSFAAIAENLSKETGFEKYAKKYRELSPTIYDRAVNSVMGLLPVFKVFLHGDLWKNNIMFKHNDDQLDDVRFIDFQNCFWGSPAFDLVHLLYSSGSRQVLGTHLEQLVAEYHGFLQASLISLGLRRQADAYPLQQLWRDVGQLAVHGLCMSAVAPHILLAQEALTDDIDTAVGDDARADLYFTRCVNNPDFMAHIKILAPVFERKGVL